MKTKQIKFNIPYIGKQEAASAARAIRSMKIVGNGVFGQRCESMLKKMVNVKHALLTTSGTHALELALMSIGIQPNDEVICPSFTFVSTANAIVREKAVPVFADIDEATLNIDVEDMKKRITQRTRAIIPVHYAGISCNMDEIMKIARKKRIAVVEDAAHGIGAKYKNKYLGTIGDIGCFSFHATKNIICGEGGALLTSDNTYYENAEMGREKGTNRSAYLKGKVDKYSWITKGSSYVLSDILASVLAEQLKKVNEVTKKRVWVFNYYLNAFKDLRDKGKVRLPEIGRHCGINGHIFYLRLNTEKERNRCIAELAKKGIESTFHFVPLHTSPYGRKVLRYKKGDFPVTEKASKTLLRLPVYPQLSKKELDFIISAVTKIL